MRLTDFTHIDTACACSIELKINFFILSFQVTKAYRLYQDFVPPDGEYFIYFINFFNILTPAGWVKC